MIKDLDKKVARAMELHYERGFVDGMQKQMQSSVDKAVNRMAQTQEPVACEHKRTSIWTEDQTGHCNDCGASGRMRFIADTTPPQRTWVGLTDEEIDKLRSGYQSGRIGSFVALAQAIEAKLKELNT